MEKVTEGFNPFVCQVSSKMAGLLLKKVSVTLVEARVEEDSLFNGQVSRRQPVSKVKQQIGS